MKADKLAFVDFLRGIAILLVIWVHHGQRFKDLPSIQVVSGFGQMGVQLFFVASAYTLCRSMDARPGEPVRNFYIRRFFRIAPLYYCGIFFYAVAAYIFGDFASYSAPNVLANVIFVHGLVPSANNTIVPGGWSIATEMMFYAVFPLLFMVARRHPSLSVVAAISLNVAVQLFIIYGLHRSGIANNTFLYYSLLNQLPVFLIGIWLFAHDIEGKAIWLDAVLMVLFGLACFACLNWYGHLTAILSPVLAGISFAFLFRLARRLVAQGGTIARIGQVSYSMYVFHFIFAWWVSGYLMKLGSDYGVPLVLVYAGTLALTVGCSYVLAAASKRVIEDPFISLGSRLIKRISTTSAARASAPTNRGVVNP